MMHVARHLSKIATLAGNLACADGMSSQAATPLSAGAVSRPPSRLTRRFTGNTRRSRMPAGNPCGMFCAPAAAAMHGHGSGGTRSECAALAALGQQRGRDPDGHRSQEAGGSGAAAGAQRRCAETGRLLVHQWQASSARAVGSASLTGVVVAGAGRPTGGGPDHPHQDGRHHRRAAQGHPPSGQRGLALRSGGASAHSGVLHERLAAPVLTAGQRRLRYRPPAAPLAGQYGVPRDTVPAQGVVRSVHRREPAGPRHRGWVGAAAAGQLAGLCPRRRVVRLLRVLDQLLPWPRGACGVRNRVQGQAVRHLSRPAHCGARAPALHRGSSRHCREHSPEPSPPPPSRATAAGGRSCPRTRLETALPGQARGVLHHSGSRPGDLWSTPRVRAVHVLRAGQLALEVVCRPGRLSRAPLRGSQAAVHRGASGRDACPGLLHPGALRPGPLSRRGHPPTSRRAHLRTATGCADDGGDRVDRSDLPTLPTSASLIYRAGGTGMCSGVSRACARSSAAGARLLARAYSLPPPPNDPSSAQYTTLLTSGTNQAGGSDGWRVDGAAADGGAPRRGAAMGSSLPAPSALGDRATAIAGGSTCG